MSKKDAIQQPLGARVVEGVPPVSNDTLSILGSTFSDTTLSFLQPNLSLPWPQFVPSQQAARKALVGQLNAGPWAEMTRAMRAELRALEQASLEGRQLPFDAQSLANALVETWRLRAALTLAPDETTSIDNPSLDALLEAADAALKAIPTDADELVAPVFESVKRRLSSLAYDVSSTATGVPLSIERHQRVTFEHVRPELAPGTTTEKSLPKSSNAQQPAAKRQRRLLALTAISVVIALSYRAYFAWQSTPKNPVPIPSTGSINSLDVQSINPTTKMARFRFRTPPDTKKLNDILAVAQQMGATAYMISPLHFVILPPRFKPTYPKLVDVIPTWESKLKKTPPN